MAPQHESVLKNLSKRFGSFSLVRLPRSKTAVNRGKGPGQEASMAVFPIIAEPQATREVQAVFSEFRRTLGTGFVPNFFKTLANAPSIMEGTWKAYANIGHKGTIPVVLKEMLFAAIAASRGCAYCEAAHMAFAKTFGADGDSLRLVRTDIDKLQPIRTRDVIRFAVRCATAPEKLTAEDYQLLQSHGLSTAEILELIAMSAFAVYASIIADATKVETDAEFLKILEPGEQQR
jgi:uncharacterized peroxidase-related enzyme